MTTPAYVPSMEDGHLTAESMLLGLLLDPDHYPRRPTLTRLAARYELLASQADARRWTDYAAALRTRADAIRLLLLREASRP